MSDSPRPLTEEGLERIFRNGYARLAAFGFLAGVFAVGVVGWWGLLPFVVGFVCGVVEEQNGRKR